MMVADVQFFTKTDGLHNTVYCRNVHVNGEQLLLLCMLSFFCFNVHSGLIFPKFLELFNLYPFFFFLRLFIFSPKL
jgi:hypothetical protein